MANKFFNLQVRPIFYDGELGRLMWIAKNGNNLAEGTIYCQQKDAAKLTQTEVDNFIETYRLYYKIESILEAEPTTEKKRRRKNE